MALFIAELAPSRAQRGTFEATGKVPRYVGMAAFRLMDMRQNRKYRCAIGSTVAGSQVRSSPLARTS